MSWLIRNSIYQIGRSDPIFETRQQTSRQNTTSASHVRVRLKVAYTWPDLNSQLPLSTFFSPLSKENRAIPSLHTMVSLGQSWKTVHCSPLPFVTVPSTKVDWSNLNSTLLLSSSSSSSSYSFPTFLIYYLNPLDPRRGASQFSPLPFCFFSTCIQSLK